MKAVGVFASAGVLLLMCSGGALAEGNGGLWYRESAPAAALDQQRDGNFFGFFPQRRQRHSQTNTSTGTSNGSSHSNRQPVEVEPPPAIEQIVVYQPEKLVPLSASAFTEAASLLYVRDAPGGRRIPDRLTSYNEITPEPVNLDDALKALASSSTPAAYLASLQPAHPAYPIFKAALKEKRKEIGDVGENELV